MSNESGLLKLFKAFGFDPNQIMGEVKGAIAQGSDKFNTTVNHFDLRLRGIEERLHRIEQKLGATPGEPLPNKPITEIVILNPNSERTGTNG